MEKVIMAQALMSCSRGECAACLYRGQGIACKKRLMEAAAAYMVGGMSRRDYIQTWGMLQALKDIYESKAKDAAGRGDDTGAKLTASYYKTIKEIAALQEKINREADAAEGGDQSAGE